MLEITDLELFYGGIHALKGVSLSVGKGQIVTLVGANGAGKSSVVRAVVGLSRARSGSIVFNGEEISKLPTHEVIRRGIGVSPEGRRVFANLTVEENLEIASYASPRSLTSAQGEWVFQLFPLLKDRRKQLAGTLSGGEQQMLALGRALMCRPKLVLLDEPSLGLAPLMVQEVFRSIKAINNEGTSILLVEQNALSALETAAFAYVLETGRVIMKGEGRALLGDDRVRRAYLGE